MSHPNEYPIDALELHNPSLPKDASLKGSWAPKSVGVWRARKWMAIGLIGLILATIVLASAAFGEAQAPCYQAYLMSGFNPQQTSFEEFRGLYSDTPLCVPSGAAR